MLLAHHPNVQSLAFSKLSHLAKTCQVDFIDISFESQLPYLTALIMEVHRFNPPVNIISHSPLEDDLYNGYTLPKGSDVGCNAWYNRFHTYFSTDFTHYCTSGVYVTMMHYMQIPLPLIHLDFST
jgi:cytochrome P450